MPRMDDMGNLLTIEEEIAEFCAARGRDAATFQLAATFMLMSRMLIEEGAVCS